MTSLWTAAVRRPCCIIKRSNPTTQPQIFLSRELRLQADCPTCRFQSHNASVMAFVSHVAPWWLRPVECSSVLYPCRALFTLRCVAVWSSTPLYRLPLLTPSNLLVCYSLLIKNLLVCIFSSFCLFLDFLCVCVCIYHRQDSWLNLYTEYSEITERLNTFTCSKYFKTGIKPSV